MTEVRENATEMAEVITDLQNKNEAKDEEIANLQAEVARFAGSEALVKQRAMQLRAATAPMVKQLENLTTTVESPETHTRRVLDSLKKDNDRFKVQNENTERNHKNQVDLLESKIKGGKKKIEWLVPKISKRKAENLKLDEKYFKTEMEETI